MATTAQRQEQELLISGSEAIAIACGMADVDVITAYPIRPYDTVMQYVSRLVADGELDCEFIVAESEHSQFEIVKHASAVGARVFCGSSGVGWFYAFEALAVTAGLRLPVVAMVGNRALDDPGAFGTEHNDALAVRDLGWMLNWVSTAQEALDTALMAWAHRRGPQSLPAVRHQRRRVLPDPLPGADQRPRQVPRGQVSSPGYDRGDKILHPDNPITVAPQVNEDWLMEIRRQTDEGMRRAKGVVEEVHEEFRDIFGRGTPSPFYEEYMTDDAEVVFVGMGTLALPVRVAVRQMREQGIKVGFVRIKWFRPFATEEIKACLSRFKAIGVVDRDYSFGSPDFGGVLYNDIRAALYDLEKRPLVMSFIAGLGGREVRGQNVIEMKDLMYEALATGKIDPDKQWIGV